MDQNGAGDRDGWYERGLPVNAPEDVGKAIILCATANRGVGARRPFAGKVGYVAGGESHEIEDQLQEVEPVWLGEEDSRVLETSRSIWGHVGMLVRSRFQ